MNLLKYTCGLFVVLASFNSTFAQSPSFSLENFYKYNPILEHQVDQVFYAMNDTTRVAQMVVTSAGELGKPEAVVLKLAQENKIGGVVFLKGTKESHKGMIDSLNAIAVAQNQLPLLFSIDAEPSLFNGRLQGTKPMMNTIDIKTTAQADSIATIINTEISEIGFHQNFAPVVDISPENEAIKNRSFGNDKANVIALSIQFIETSQRQGIIATAKHFPGHGLVTGDTHKKSVYIDGPLQEVAMYPPLIEAGVISIMMAHITIRNNPKYNTGDLPASCSKNIVTGLLKEELGFKGLVITDALNIMKAVTIIDNAPLIASKAGNDMLLMPIDETKTIASVLQEMQASEAYKTQVYESVKKIIRLKICSGLIKRN
ncbi:glycoside hydrolase family 3 N-terminal domain-containing protein [Patiriisocius sp. Uisw_017]|jgi:beta-N-acetylhexosaminidase|uniref:glycoside hydrolase family 3 N-terminal domain-containing protein n=1 Tax=Patiriisocius sp. Uisw_017 TaxID=3230968 RepID=UPI0039ED9B0C